MYEIELEYLKCDSTINGCFDANPCAHKRCDDDTNPNSSREEPLFWISHISHALNAETIVEITVFLDKLSV
jgi:hypothetical protein